MQTTTNLAFSESAISGYNDPTAILTGTWDNDQRASAVVHASSAVHGGTGGSAEVELRLRSSMSANVCEDMKYIFPAFMGRTMDISHAGMELIMIGIT